MSFTLQNSLGGSVVLDQIEEGYKSTYELSGHAFKGEQGIYKFFDDGVMYDKVRATFSAIVDATNMANLETLYNDSRDAVFTLTPNANRGLALFTPAFGDQGPFNFYIEKFSQSAPLNSTIYKYYRVQFSVYSSADLPTYSPVLGNDEGNITIGQIGGIRYPVNNFNLAVDMDAGVKQTALNVNYSNDLSSQNEITKFKLRLLHDKMSLLIKNLKTNRYGELDLIVPDDVAPFGAAQIGTRHFKTRMLNKTLEVTQVKNKRYELELTLQRLSNVQV
jgi:hypothetical protein